ncbi:unnamed protein product [Orchesella dallaii]|uniref:Uncharacterized protein n=1 Tax=Orchesella dallaii TaxID=48710 RepID=A0ABP1RP39_9HEXA
MFKIIFLNSPGDDYDDDELSVMIKVLKNRMERYRMGTRAVAVLQMMLIGLRLALFSVYPPNLTISETAFTHSSVAVADGWAIHSCVAILTFQMLETSLLFLATLAGVQPRTITTICGWWVIMDVIWMYWLTYQIYYVTPLSITSSCISIAWKLAAVEIVFRYLAGYVVLFFKEKVDVDLANLLSSSLLSMETMFHMERYHRVYIYLQNQDIYLETALYFYGRLDMNIGYLDMLKEENR